MSINILQVTFFTQYIISPKTWIHKISCKSKIILIFTYLLLAPYVNYQYIILCIIFSIIVLLNLPIPKDYILNIQQTLCIFILFTFSMYTNTNHLHTQIYNNPNTYITNKNVQPFNLNKFFIMIKPSVNQQIIPIYVIRGYLIYLIYVILLKTLYLTTKYENMITSYIVMYTNHLHNDNFLPNISMIILTSQFIILLIKRADITMKSLKLRGSLYGYLYAYHALKKLLNDIYVDIARLSLALYYREISITKLTLYKNYLNLYE